MATYNIYLVNRSTDMQTFWCFLAPPRELANDPGVFANSSVSMAVQPNAPGSTVLTIPERYIVGAGAGNQAVGLEVRIISNAVANAAVGQTFDVGYITVPPNEGPTIDLSGTSAPPNTIAIACNAFDRSGNENNGWFSNMSFGIESPAGFAGMTWSPNPQSMRTLTPDLTFYIAVGSFGSNALTDWMEVADYSAVVSVPGSFSGSDCTATFEFDGTWVITPGKPH